MAAMDRDTEMENINQIIDHLVVMFGAKLSREALFSIVECYGGDINDAANAVMSIISESPPDSLADHIACSMPANTSASEVVSTPQLSYASQASVSTRVAPVPVRQQNCTPYTAKQKPNYCPTEIQSIFNHHVNGNRVLVFTRGLSGSGKSFLAKYIVDETIGQSLDDYKRHVCSTDDFFITSNGLYNHNKYRLSEAHTWNQARVKLLLRKGVSPVIVDNTNIELWEMEPYARDGVANGYILEVVEPKTPWCKNAGALAKKNIHNVPFMLIRRKLDNYQEGLTGKILIDSFKLTYPDNLRPPVLRNFPLPSLEANEILTSGAGNTTNVIGNNLNVTDPSQNSSAVEASQHSSMGTNNNQKPTSPLNQKSEIERRQQYEQVQLILDNIDKFSSEWDNNPSWEENTEQSVSSTPKPSVSTNQEPKPERLRKRNEIPSTSSVNLYKGDSVNMSLDWQTFLPSMRPTTTIIRHKVDENLVEKRDNSTSMNLGDAHNVNNYRELIGYFRDINQDYIPYPIENIPDVRMLDKSTMTNDPTITDAVRCKNEEKHFVAFRKLFSNISRPVLRDIFDKCHGNVNWAVEIVFDGMANKDFVHYNEELSDIDDDEEEIRQDQCDCLAAYDVIPNVPLEPKNKSIPVDPIQFEITEHQKKVKKKIALSEESIQLKRQIEKNVVIGDHHYPQYCLGIIKKRRGDYLKRGDLSLSLNTGDLGEQHDNIYENCNASTSQASTAHDVDLLSTEKSDDEDSVDKCEEMTVSIDLSKDLLSQIDEHFSRKDMPYHPSNMNTNINIPVSILNQINALWIESLVYQIEEQTKQTNLMVQQDEEFARQIVMKEAELASAGKEPQVPDFKEIMDMDLALSLYQKDVAEWRNKEPNDYAAKMTRDKLYNLFPDVSHNTLSELLMAHDNNFKATVESLLMSTGNAEVLEEENGVNKYVMQKELEQKQKLLEEQKNAAKASEWPLLSDTEEVTYELANNCRKEAEHHLNARKLNIEKVSEYTRVGMTDVASYYSEVARYHTSRYEQLNSRAVVMFVKANAIKNPKYNTLDLHYLRVGEAHQALDLYIDSQIQRLRDQPAVRGSVARDALFIITGRGLHSVGGPKLKPAMIRRVRARGLRYEQMNPGLLTVFISSNELLTCEFAKSN